MVTVYIVESLQRSQCELCVAAKPWRNVKQGKNVKHVTRLYEKQTGFIPEGEGGSHIKVTGILVGKLKSNPQGRPIQVQSPSKGKGKGKFGRAFGLAPQFPSPSFSNACHTGYRFNGCHATLLPTNGRQRRGALRDDPNNGCEGDLLRCD